MENNHLGRNVFSLKIGNFIISISRGYSSIPFEIPASGMAFNLPNEALSDFQLMLDSVEPDNSGKLLFGSDDFAIPTFLYQRDSGCYDWITKQRDFSPGVSFRISEDWTRFILYEDCTNTRGERAFHEFGSLFSFAALNFTSCVLHGVVMEYEGKGILITASAGTGKTTHSRMWRDHKNALILNGDRCLCRKVNDTWFAYGMPWAGSSGEYINRKVPICCIVNLNRGIENIARKMSVSDSFVYLLQRIFAPIWQGNLQNKAIKLCEEMALDIPVIEFYCKPDLESVTVLEQAIKTYGK